MTAKTSGFLGGKLKLIQSQAGYRAGIDAALLASALDIPAGKRAVEFGCGPGAALLSAACFNPEADFLGLEIDAAASDMAQSNITANDLSDRVGIETGDALAWRGEHSVDAVFFNPPFFDDPNTLRAPKPDKQTAWINPSGLAHWINAGLKRLKEGGTLTIIHRADRLADILTSIGARAGDIQVLPIHPRADQPAKRVIVSARKVSKTPLQILPGLVLHDETGATYTPAADAVLKGVSKLALLKA